jgi:hypothetical protein
MFTACQRDAVTNILSLGEDIDTLGAPNGTALMVACEHGLLGIVKVLVHDWAAIDVTH